MSITGANASREVVERHLAQILRSAEFRNADRPSRLLRHLVEQTLDGRGALLKEFGLAIDVLGRDEAFDPRTDAIVRVEVSRLRSRLKKYYQNSGRTDELLIEIPAGSYQPIFRDAYLSAEVPIVPVPSPPVAPQPWWIPALGIGLLVVGVFVLSATRPEAAPRHPQLVRITGEGSRSEFPSGSRKTGTLVYASDRGGSNLNIWVQALDGGDPRQLTTNEADDYDPDLSADGRTVVFQSDREQPGIYISPVSSRAERLIAARGNRPRFSPDGRQVAYWVGGGPYGNLLLPGQTYSEIVDVATGASRRLAGGFVMAMHPTWSADGKRLLFWGRKTRGEIADWWIAPLDGGEPRATGAIQAIRAEGLRPPPWFYQNISPERWLANGDVLFSASEGESANIWRIRIAGSAVVPGQLSRVTTSPNLDLFPSAIDDRYLAYAVVSRTVDLWSIAFDTNQGIPKAAPVRLTDDATWKTFPTVALDGGTLLFGRKGSAARTPQFLNASTGAVSTARLDSPNRFADATPVFSADGSAAVLMVDEANSLVSYLVDPVSGQNRRLCVDCRTWIVDRKRAIISPGRRYPPFVSLDLETGKQDVLIESSSGLPRFPSVSPDGRWIAFEFSRADGSEIAIAPLDAHAPVPEAQWTAITGLGDAAGRPRFSPNGKLLYYVSQRDGHMCVWAQPLSDGKPHGAAFAVTHFHSAQHSLANLFSPDFNLSVARDKLVYNAAQVRSNIWLFDSSAEREADGLRAGLRLYP